MPGLTLTCTMVLGVGGKACGCALPMLKWKLFQRPLDFITTFSTAVLIATDLVLRKAASTTSRFANRHLNQVHHGPLSS